MVSVAGTPAALALMQMLSVAAQADPLSAVRPATLVSVSMTKVLAAYEFAMSSTSPEEVRVGVLARGTERLQVVGQSSLNRVRVAAEAALPSVAHDAGLPVRTRVGPVDALVAAATVVVRRRVVGVPNHLADAQVATTVVERVAVGVVDDEGGVGEHDVPVHVHLGPAQVRLGATVAEPPAVLCDAPVVRLVDEGVLTA